MTATTDFVALHNELNHRLQLVNGAFPSATASVLLFMRDAQGGITLRNLTIAHAIEIEFLLTARKFISIQGNKYSNNYTDLEQFDVGCEPEDHHVEWLDKTDPLVASALAQIPAQLPVVADLQDAELATHEIRAYAVVVDPPLAPNTNDRIVLFRRFNKSKQLNRAKGLLLKSTGGRYERLSDITLQFDEGFDAIAYKSHVYLFSRYNSKVIFDFEAAFRNQAMMGLQAIVGQIQFDRPHDFVTDCLAHPLKITKVVSIMSRGHLNNLNLQHLINTIQTHSVNVATGQYNGTPAILYDIASSWEILSLLDDSFVTSAATSTRYKANSKKRV